jgi:N6-adenosine-specific RNA methylase IME4
VSDLVVFEQLTLVEIDRLAELEAVVERGLQTFVEVGLALAEIRDSRLYRESHGTFEAYLDERWGMSRGHGYRLIDGAQVAELVSPIGDIANEAQARELVPLLADEAELVETFRELRAEHGDRLTAEKVRAAVDDRLRRDQALERPTVERPAPPAGSYDLIYADPPWRYEAPGGETPELRAVERHYPTMTVEEISALPVPAAPDAACFLWATNPLLREALEVLDSWGFTYRTNLAWVKDRIGMGYWVRGQHELLLIGRRGNTGPPVESLRPPSVLHAPRLAHSAKPDAIYGLLEAMFPSATRIELFARVKRPGWDTWGALAA